MMLQFAELRVKQSVFPSGVKVGEPSFAGPETTPGAKISGDGIAAGSLARLQTWWPSRNETRRALREMWFMVLVKPARLLFSA
jgi:hypothetical protein